MSDDNSQDTDDLFGTDESDSSTDAASTTNADDAASDQDGTGDAPEKDEESQEDLDLDVDEKPIKNKKTADAAQQFRDQQVDLYADRVASGKITLDEIPKDWIKDLVAKKFEKATDGSGSDGLEDLLDQKLNEREANKNFADLQADLRTTKLSSSQKREISTEFKDLVKSGVSKAMALEKAIKIAGIKLSLDTKSARRAAMNTPRPSSFSEDRKSTEVDEAGKFKEMPEKDRMALYEDQIKNN